MKRLIPKRSLTFSLLLGSALLSPALASGQNALVVDETPAKGSKPDLTLPRIRLRADTERFLLSAFGFDLLLDSGNAASDSEQAKPLPAIAFRNSVMMDESNSRREAEKSRLTNTLLLDYYDGVNGGYKGNSGERSAQHRRRILFLKPALIFVVDDLTAEQPHDWTLRFHFAQGELAFRPNNRQVMFAVAVAAPVDSSRPADPNSADVARQPAGLNLWSQEARKPQMEKTAAAIGNKVRQIPVVRWTVAQAKTAHFATLIAPFGDEGSLDQWEVREDKSGATVAYSSPDSPMADLLYIKANTPPAPNEAAVSGRAFGLETDADAAYIKTGPASEDAFDAPRKVFAIAALNATRLASLPDPRPHPLNVEQDDPLPLFTSSRPVERLEAYWKKDTLYVTVAGGEEVQIRTFGAKWAVVNGKRRVAIPANAPMVPIVTK